jgi:predicted Zn-ribbon and HTH transcriptional regulator
MLGSEYSTQNNKDIESAYNHIKNHITTQGEILFQLDADCEYCKVYFEEQRILNRKTV